MSAVVLVVGRRGAGKTTRARAIAMQARRVVVFDPVHEWGRDPRFSTFTGDLPGLQRALARRWRGPFRLAYVPGPEAPALELHRLARLVYLAQRLGSPPLLFVVDEAHTGYPAHALPAGCWGMRACVLQGRHRNLGVLAIAQRPALVSADLRANAHELIAFPLSHPDDRRALERVIGEAHGPALDGLIAHHFLHWRAEGAEAGVKKGRNRLGAKRPPVHPIPIRPGGDQAPGAR